MTVTSNDIANQALQLIGDNTLSVSGNAPTFDNSTAGQALHRLYAPCVRTVARQFGWDFARNAVVLVLTGNTPILYAYEYVYPTFAVEIWQLVPTGQDPNNPLPVNWSVANALVSGVQTKVIQTNLASAEAIVNNNPAEAVWDDLFREAVVRLLSSELSMALFARPDSAEAYLQSGAAFESLGEARKG